LFDTIRDCKLNNITRHMSNTDYTSQAWPLERRRASSAALRRGWRLWVACFAALAFLLLSSTAATHRHASLAASHDCVLCTAVADKLADSPAPPSPVAVLQLQLYLVVFVAAYVAVFVSPRLRPPACGPPDNSV
jgi:hypothetical protein